MGMVLSVKPPPGITVIFSVEDVHEIGVANDPPLKLYVNVHPDDVTSLTTAVPV
jgi:hypothetical protein